MAKIWMGVFYECFTTNHSGEECDFLASNKKCLKPYGL